MKIPEDNIDLITRLYEVIVSRKGADVEKSYTAMLFSQGTRKIAQKLGEEALETVIAATNNDRKQTIAESADLIYHMLVVWADAGILPSEVIAELERREGTSGHTEKMGRK